MGRTRSSRHFLKCLPCFPVVECLPNWPASLKVRNIGEGLARGSGPECPTNATKEKNCLQATRWLPRYQVMGQTFGRAPSVQIRRLAAPAETLADPEGRSTYPRTGDDCYLAILGWPSLPIVTRRKVQAEAAGAARARPRPPSGAAAACTLPKLKGAAAVAPAKFQCRSGTQAGRVAASSPAKLQQAGRVSAALRQASSPSSFTAGRCVSRRGRAASWQCCLALGTRAAF